MKIDFTLSLYKFLITAFQFNQYTFQSFQNFLKEPALKSVILRHDVDKLPANALKMAQIEYSLGVAATYYFRVVPESWDEKVMAQIAALGHEIGYHYEDLTIAKGVHKKAIRHFETQLARFRQSYPVKTICMHGSPLSRFDNRDLWKSYNYRDFGIIGEPYFDVDYTRVFYITDTGRKWNNADSSIRDRVDSGFDIPVRNTAHLVELIEQEALPEWVMITVHPQRWHDRPLPWIKELVWQNTKNVVKQNLKKAQSR